MNITINDFRTMAQNAMKMEFKQQNLLVRQAFVDAASAGLATTNYQLT